MSDESTAPRRVLICIPNMLEGGAERMAIHLAKNLDRKRYDVRLLAHEGIGTLEKDAQGVDVRVVVRRPYTRRNLPRYLRATVEHAGWADVIVAANEGRATTLATCAAMVAHKPIVAWIQNDWSEFSKIVSWRQRLSMQCYRYMNRVVACSQGAAEGLGVVVPLDQSRIRVLHNSVPIDEIARESLQPLPPNAAAWFDVPVILAIGRLEYQKAFDRIIRAHAEVKRRGVDHRLVLIGQGKLEADLRGLAGSLGVDGSVVFAGFQANPWSYMRAATALAMSSRFEGMPLVLAEALACGLPIVSMDCPSGPAEVFEKGACGVLVPRDDERGLADGIERIIRDPSFRAAAVAEALRIAHEFDVHHMCREFEAVLDGAIEEGRSTRVP